MGANARKGLILGVVIAAAVVLIGGTLLIARVFSGWDGDERPAPFRGRGGPFRDPFIDDYRSNGERIYFTGTSETGPPITAEMPGMHSMPSGMMTCAACHGTDGRGGPVRMMMATFTAPDIRYDNLTSPEHGAGEDEEHDDGEAGHAEHPPYTDQTIKRAITEGVDPAGEPLEWMMPRWRMTDGQLNDLIAYLKAID
jgi:cytochrome c oxidase subunit 2